MTEKKSIINDPERQTEQIKKYLTVLFKGEAFLGKISIQQMGQLIQTTGLSESELCLSMLPVAASFAITPISKFNVGAIVKGLKTECFYFGANIEFSHTHLGNSVHAEQSAIAHAWANGEEELTALYVNYSPCGHCRQFMNELHHAENLTIQLPNQPQKKLETLLPSAFGPSDLGINERLLAPATKQVQLSLSKQNGDIQKYNNALIEQALLATTHSYSPYSNVKSGIVLTLNDGHSIVGQYAENAAFNPSLLPLQSALIQMQMQRRSFHEIAHALLIETLSKVGEEQISHRSTTEGLLKQLQPMAKLEYLTACLEEES